MKKHITYDNYFPNFVKMKFITIITSVFMLSFLSSCKKDEKTNHIPTHHEVVNFEQDLGLVYQESINKFPPLFLNSLELAQLNISTEDFDFKQTMSLYNDYLETNDGNSKDAFLRKANELKSKNSTFSNRHNNSNSLITHCLTIVILSQAYAISNEDAFRIEVGKLLKQFEKPNDKGGFQKNLSDYSFFTNNNPNAKMILTHHNLALLTFYYCYKSTQNENAKQLLKQGIGSLKLVIADFDSDFTSLYSLEMTDEQEYAFSSAMGEDPDFYHELLIKQLLLLYLESGEDLLRTYAHHFLKQDLGSFSIFSGKSKFSDISATHSVDKKTLGINHLDDELWSWGKYWSTNQFPTELSVRFDEKKKDIESLTFFSIKKNTSPDNFNIYVENGGNWRLVAESSKIKKTSKYYYKTGNYETYIDTYFFNTKFEGSSIKIEFLENSNTNLITLRELNISFDRSNDIESMLKNIKTEIGTNFLN